MKMTTFFKRHPVPAALIILAIAAVIAVVLNYKSDLITALRPGETITIHLAQDYKLVPSQSYVKMSGAPIGNVQSVDQPEGNGQVTVTLKVANGTRALLGSEPRATVRPTTVLGGKYFVELSSGGQPGEFTGDIPVERTRLPVELDKVLSAIPPDAQRGFQGLTVRLEDTLKTSTPMFKQLLKDAPASLQPAGVVLDGLRGQNKDTDLSQLVISANTATRVLSAKPGQLRAIVDSLATTSRAFGDNADAVARTIADLPGTLRDTRTGAADLSTTLDKLIDTAGDARPSVRALDPLFKRLDPTLDEASDLLHNLRPLISDARPLTDELKPTIRKGTDVLDDLNGPVLDRVNGPILTELNRPWVGSCPKYCGGGHDGAGKDASKYYEELAYLVTSLTGLTQYQTTNHHLIGFEVGGGSTTPLNTGTAAEQFQRQLATMFGLPHQGPNGGSANPPLIPGTGQGFQVPLPNPGGHEPGFDPTNPQRGVR
jgi:phospholipid/cholesterol/gamma-HCH transport system substrate-binding protein